MRAGLLRDTITIQRLDIAKDSFGSITSNWIDKITTRAQVKVNSGNRVNQNNEIINTYNVSFLIRLYHNVNESDRIIYNHKKYRIISIDKELPKQSITIIGELINE